MKLSLGEIVGNQVYSSNELKRSKMGFSAPKAPKIFGVFLRCQKGIPPPGVGGVSAQVGEISIGFKKFWGNKLYALVGRV